MLCRVNFQSDPISLIIISAEGKEHQFFDAVGDGGFIEVEIAAEPIVADDGAEQAEYGKWLEREVEYGCATHIENQPRA
jgi:hypothetical protein